MNKRIEPSDIFSDTLVDTENVQALLLHASKTNHVVHIFVRFGSVVAGRKFLENLQPKVTWGEKTPGTDDSSTTEFELTVGMTFQGLQALDVPEDRLSIFRRQAPAYTEGAAARAAERLGDVGASSAKYWDEIFEPDNVHAVVTIHGSWDSAERGRSWGEKTLLADLNEDTRRDIVLSEPLAGARLSPPKPIDKSATAEEAASDPWHDTQEEEEFDTSVRKRPAPMWVHFGYRDGLTSNKIRTRKNLKDARNLHEPGELLLGEPRNSGDNPWNLVDHANSLRDFFRHGSFGAFRQIEQDEKAFREQVDAWVDELNRSQEWGPATTLTSFVRAKLCGRWPNGQVIKVDDRPDQISHRPIECNEFSFFAEPSQTADNSSENDAQGKGCPFASHIRRMNPRDENGVQMHRRPVFRRGMPYGPWYEEGEKPGIQRGLLGVFFCADLELQFEHLLGEWSDRLPLGMPGDRAQKDPLMGVHMNPQTGFSINRCIDSGQGKTDAADQSHTLKDFRQFVRTRGTAYCFYPSKLALKQLAAGG